MMRRTARLLLLLVVCQQAVVVAARLQYLTAYGTDANSLPLTHKWANLVTEATDLRTEPDHSSQAPLIPDSEAPEDSHKSDQGQQPDDKMEADIQSEQYSQDDWLDNLEYEDSDDDDELDQVNLDKLSSILAERDAVTTGL